jgi:hypothetical protein
MVLMFFLLKNPNFSSIPIQQDTQRGYMNLNTIHTFHGIFCKMEAGTVLLSSGISGTYKLS